MKAVLKFNLPDEQIEFNMAVQAPKMHYVLWEMDQWLRGQTKHAPDDMSQDTFDAIILCRETLRDLMRNENISFDD